MPGTILVSLKKVKETQSELRLNERREPSTLSCNWPVHLLFFSEHTAQHLAKGIAADAPIVTWDV